MNESHLNSIHLELPRRDLFRQARRQLLDSCGQCTLELAAPQARLALSASETVAGLAPSPAAQTPFGLLEHGRLHPLKVGFNTIGRLPDNDVVVANPHVSRRHCAVLVHSNEVCEIHDTASKNGTFINGQRLEGPLPLKPGDEIRLCDLVLVFTRREPQE